MARVLLPLAAAAWIVAAAVLVSGGISFRFAGVLIRAHSAVPSLVVAILLTAVIAIAARRSVGAAAAWWWRTGARRAPIVAAALAVLAVAIGVQWGAFVAGGSDSYCYLNQAELFARGEVHDVEPLGADPAWPGPPISFTPAGHSLVPSQAGALSPICPAGYPALMAVARLAGGRAAMFWVTPLMGGLAVWLTFLLGRRVGGASAGLFAALLLATSPIFIYQVVQPMNDVPATALWCAALVLVIGERFGLAGLAVGAALTVRPNLLPVGVFVGLWVLIHDWRAGLRFGLACIPGLAFVLIAQDAMYGSPLRSGYGDLSSLFSWDHVLPNLSRYPRWVLEVHTPALAAALAAPWLPALAGKRTPATFLLLFAATVFACYLPYVVFEEWWYQRFVLPALPPLLALAAAVVMALLARFSVPWRAAAFVIFCAAFGLLYLHTGVQRDAFRLRDLEHRFRSGGEYVARLPANAAIVTNHQSGSVRFYSGRSTVGWGDIPAGRLNDALEFLRRHGRKPYLLLETWEEPEFRRRFAASDPLGQLAWPPLAEIERTVRIYDPDDHARYMRGEAVLTDRVLTRRK